MFNLSPIYSARKSSNYKLSINHKISPDTNLHKTKHTQTSNTKFSNKKHRWTKIQPGTPTVEDSQWWMLGPEPLVPRALWTKDPADEWGWRTCQWPLNVLSVSCNPWNLCKLSRRRSPSVYFLWPALSSAADGPYMYVETKVTTYAALKRIGLGRYFIILFYL